MYLNGVFVLQTQLHQRGLRDNTPTPMDEVESDEKPLIPMTLEFEELVEKPDKGGQIGLRLSFESEGEDNGVEKVSVNIITTLGLFPHIG